MKYKNTDYRAREAHARAWAHTLASQAGWTCTSRPELLPPALRGGAYDPEAHLVLLASAGDLPRGLEVAVAETRCTALVVEPGFAMTGFVTCYFTLLRATPRGVEWHRALRLWLGKDKRLFLIADPAGDDPDGECFLITRWHIRPCARPCSDPFECGRGIGEGDTLLLMSWPMPEGR